MSFTRTGGIHMAIRNSTVRSISSYLKDEFRRNSEKAYGEKRKLMYLLKTSRKYVPGRMHGVNGD